MSHAARVLVAPTLPQHVTLRMVEGLPSLRQGWLVAIIRGAIEAAQRSDFRIVHFNIESNHIHLVIETDGNRARSRGVQGLKVRIARGLNRALGRRGTVFADRYHALALTSPRQVRNTLRYVLNNARHHGLGASDPTWIDPYSSAIWFDGWKRPIEIDAYWKRRLLAMSPPPVVRPRVWLLTVGWRRHGAIGFDEVPGERARGHRR